MKPTSPAESLAITIVRRLQEAGHVAYFAGGCVRDRLMGREPHDFDVATAAHPEVVLRLFPRSQKVGVAFGVVLVRQQQQTVEVATFRTEGVYADGRHPTSVAFTDAQHDAQRRDFTCNGLFFDPLAGQIHDFVGGQQDIAARVLRAIGDPHRRFAEDYLRILRAVRFQQKLGFVIDPATEAAMRENAAGLQKLSKERIAEELRGTLGLSHPWRAAETLSTDGLLTAMLPELARSRPPGLPWKRLQRMEKSPSWIAVLQALLRDLLEGESPNWETLTEYLRTQLLLSNQEIAEFSWIAEQLPILHNWRALDRAALKRRMASAFWPSLLALHAAEQVDVAESAALIQRLAEMQAEGVNVPPLVSGNDLIRMGASPGPQFKAWLEQLYDRQLNLEFPSREAALAAATALVQRANAATAGE